MSFQKIVKAAKIVKAGAKKVKVHQGAYGVNCSDGDQELSLWLDTEGESLPEITWDSLELFELEAKLGYNLIEAPGEPAGLAVSAQEWKALFGSLWRPTKNRPAIVWARFVSRVKA